MTAQRRPPSAPPAPRWLELAGAHNVRDIGGLRAGDRRVAAGVLLRSDQLDDTTPEDLALLVGTWGLRGVIDLRADVEDPQPPTWTSHGVVGLSLPLIDLSGTTDRTRLRGTPEQAYSAMLELAGASLARILRFLVREDGTPALVHCAAGKDRTGIAVAVLLAAAGVDEADILADYVATGERLPQVRARLVAKSPYYAQAAGKLLESEMDAAPIVAVLGELAAHAGGAEGFLVAHGATPSEVQDWRSLLLE